MRKYFTLLLPLVALFVLGASCKQLIVIDTVIEKKASMDAAENPAMKHVINNELREKRVQLFDLVVKDVIPSTNIDYDFCVILDIQTRKGTVECYVYSSDVNTISRLVRGRSRINVTGDFSRFFSLVGDFYTMVEIVKATIEIKG